MALYLGNQKVSLRSGQDPTFDYGFDSNGRLVFANKNATEINNFLNYDSSYSEILDLSNLNKMEKVAVNGTADRKMEGLKGLLVSPNAPFTGSSPQINASYTGLSKSALVSLFESAPYNVGYTKVGNPTIVDGVASGFSDTSYLQIPNASLNLQNILVHVRFTTGTLDGTEKIIYQLSASGGTLPIAFRIHTNNRLICYHAGSQNYQIYTFTNITLEENKTYDVEFGTVNTVRYLKAGLADNMSDQTIRNGSDSDFATSVEKPQFFGFAQNAKSNYYFNGSIDLNHTYIKVNGVPWFGPGATKNLVPDGTVVGDVIVKEGIASGFSKNSNIQISEAIDTTKQFEMFLKIITSNSTSLENIVNLNRTNSVVAINKNSRFPVFLMRYIGTDGALHSTDATVKIGLENNTSYYLKTMCSSTGISLSVSNDKINWTTTTTSLPSDFASWQPSTAVNLGGLREEVFPFLGSIDLNNTYTKVGSDYSYRGMVPMTKTCSIVGATGTADLTQEDKNIILNKGWSLTVQ